MTDDKVLTLEQLERDKKQVEKSISELKVQLVRLDGIRGYLNDNINKLEEEKEDVGV